MGLGEERYDVFVAHASADKPRACVLYEALTALDLKVFFDAESLLPGDDWHEAIPAALRASDVVVVLVSPNRGYYDGEEVVISIAEVRGGKQRIVPVHLEAGLDNPYGLARKNRIDWHDEADVDAVVTQLSRVVPRAVRGEAAGASTFCHRIPVPPRFLTGRDDILDELVAGLGGGRTTTLTQTIQGMGGVGKTAVASALCEACRTDHDVVWWVRAEDDATLVADLAELATAVGVETGRGPDVDADAAVRWLETTDRRWLVVFDNVLDRDSVARWLPKRGAGASVVTSRNRHMHELGDVVPIDVLPRPLAETFLHDRVASPNPAAAREDLGPAARRAAGLPLALAQAAAWVARVPNRRFAQWVELFDEAAGEPFPEVTRPVDYDATAATTWKVSIDAAVDEAGLAGRLLEGISFLSSGSVPIAWVRARAQDPHLGGAGTPEAVDAGIDALHGYSLVDVHPDDAISVHSVVQAAARRGASATAFTFASRCLVGGVADDDGALATRSALGGVAAHALALASRIDPPAPYGTRDVAELLISLSHIGKEIGQSELAITTASTAGLIGRAIGDGLLFIVAVDLMATLARNLGDLERAIEMATTNLENARRVLGPDHHQTLTSKNHLALAHQAAGHLDVAIRLQEENLAETDRILGPDHPDSLAARNNLAGIHFEAGRLQQAIELFESIRDIRVRTLGVDHPDTLVSAHNLAGALLHNGDEARALELAADTFERRCRVLGVDHPRTTASQEIVATLAEHAGDHRTAIAMHESVCETRRRTLGPDHPLTLTSEGNVAGAYLRAGEVEIALARYESVVRDRERILGPDHPETLNGLANSAHALAEAGEADRAAGAFEAAFTRHQEVLGDSHPETIACRVFFAGTLADSGRAPEAVRHLKAALVESERAVANHPMVPSIRRRLVELRAQG